MIDEVSGAVRDGLLRLAARCSPTGTPWSTRPAARPSGSSTTPGTSARGSSPTPTSTGAPSARPTASSTRPAPEADELRKETDDYVDAKLANFEITLERTTEAVKRGRERLAGRSAFDALTSDEVDKIILPEHLEN